MNTKQLNVTWCGIGLIVLMGLVPPWTHKARYSSEPKSYSSIFYPPEDANEIDLTRLGLQCAMVGIVSAGWIFTLKSNSTQEAAKITAPNSVPSAAKYVPLAVFALAALPYWHSVYLKTQADELRCKEEKTRQEKQAEEAKTKERQIQEIVTNMRLESDRREKDFAKQLSTFSKPKKLGLKTLPSGIIALLETRMSEYGVVAYRLQILRSLDASDLIARDRFSLDFEDSNGFSLSKKPFTLSAEPGLYTGTFSCEPQNYKKIVNWNLERLEPL